LTATAIAKRVFLSPSTVVGILDRLEQKGLLGRERDTRDRRLVYVSATKEGRKLAENAPSPLQATFADALKGLPEQEQATIALSLERVVSLMEAQEVGAAPISETGSKNQDARNSSVRLGLPEEPANRPTGG
jgi:DNA-binding MarR family transcriptional regulator